MEIITEGFWMQNPKLVWIAGLCDEKRERSAQSLQPGNYSNMCWVVLRSPQVRWHIQREGRREMICLVLQTLRSVLGVHVRSDWTSVTSVSLCAQLQGYFWYYLTLQTNTHISSSYACKTYMCVHNQNTGDSNSSL